MAENMSFSSDAMLNKIWRDTSMPRESNAKADTRG